MPNKSSPEPQRKKLQKRAQETINRILDATAELLEEMGFDKLNTNLICERAGMTPPALYRYFSNKYDVLKALGERLMITQNEALIASSELDVSALPTPEVIAAALCSQYEVTKNQKGAAWIMRALHATPQLAEVRLKSHSFMVEFLVAQRKSQYPDTDEKELVRRARISVETGYGILEMLFDNPDMDVDACLSDAGSMIYHLLNKTD